MSDDLLIDDVAVVDSKKKLNQRDIELGVIRNVMSTPPGRAMYYRMLSRASVFVSCFTPDSHQHAYNAGRREYGVWLDRELYEASEDFYYLMLRENR